MVKLVEKVKRFKKFKSVKSVKMVKIVEGVEGGEIVNTIALRFYIMPACIGRESRRGFLVSQTGLTPVKYETKGI